MTEFSFRSNHSCNFIHFCNECACDLALCNGVTKKSYAFLVILLLGLQVLVKVVKPHHKNFWVASNFPLFAILNMHSQSLQNYMFHSIHLAKKTFHTVREDYFGLNDLFVSSYCLSIINRKITYSLKPRLLRTMTSLNPFSSSVNKRKYFNFIV